MASGNRGGVRRLVSVCGAVLVVAVMTPTAVHSAGLPPAAGRVAVAPASAPDGAWGSFTALGTGMSGDVYALAVLDDTLYAGGFFMSASGVTVNRIAAWSNNTWHALDTGMNQAVLALALTDDTVFAGGNFTDASGVGNTTYIAGRSDGSWHALGTGMQNTVNALAVTDDTTFAGGNFMDASGVANTTYIAGWSDGSWHALGTGMSGSSVYALGVTDDTLYAGGAFTAASGVAGTNKIAAWSDGSWHALGTGMDSSVSALAVTDDTLYAGGAFTAASGVAGTKEIAAWSDDTWHSLGGGLESGFNKDVYALAWDDTHGLLYAGGGFTSVNGGSANSLSRVGVWDVGIGEWIPLQYGTGSLLQGINNQSVRALVVDDSVLYVGGRFDNAGGVGNADRLARWTWDAPQGSNAVTGEVGDSVTITGESFVGVPRTGGVLVGSVPATYTRDDSVTITFTVPAGVSGMQTLSVTGVGGTGTVGTLTAPTPTPPPTPVVFPPGAPTAVTGTPGDAVVSVSWSAPSPGSFPISTYQVRSTPEGGTCLVGGLACEVTGLTNGTAYTFAVRALNGAGWGPWSAPSGSVTPIAPQPPVTVSILITGARGEVRGRPGVIVTGSSTGLDMGAIVRAWTRLAGQSSYTPAAASILVDQTGQFTWQRRTNKKISVYVTTDDRTSRSNRVIIRTE